MKKIYFILLMTISLFIEEKARCQGYSIELTFTASYAGQHVTLDSILIENLSKGNNVTLYEPDTVLKIAYTSIGEIMMQDPGFCVSQNFPNPFEDKTQIIIDIPHSGTVGVNVFNLLGKKLASYSGILPNGKHSFEFYGGVENIYLLTAAYAGQTLAIKMLQMGTHPSGKPGLFYHGFITTQHQEKIIGMKNLKSHVSFPTPVMPDAITIEPSYATAYDELTLTFDPAAACFQNGSLAGLPAVAIHSGVKYITGEIWQKMITFDALGLNGQATTMLPAGNGKYAITYNPSLFYGLSGETVTHLCAVFNNGSNWNQDGRDFMPNTTSCIDFLIPLSIAFDYQPGDELRYTGYAKTFEGYAGSDVILDIPQGNQLYQFEIANGLPCPYEPIISHYGVIYNTLQIGTQCWFKENLKIGDMINSTVSQTNNGIIEKYCYDDNINNCDIYGGLYCWDEMVNYCAAAGTQGICPNGWHLPTASEWDELSTILGGQNVAGGKMKTTGTIQQGTGLWLTPNTGANDSSAFSGVPGGWRSDNQNFYFLGERATFWSSSETGSNNYVWHYHLDNDNSKLGKAYTTKQVAQSVRCMKTLSLNQIPATPSNLSALAISGSQIMLSWTDNSNNEAGFKIERSANGSTGWSQIHVTTANIINYTNTGLSAATTYYYRVRAFNNIGNSAYTANAYATTTNTSLPVAPSNLTATPVSSVKINLAWTDNANNELGFVIERAPGGTFDFMTIDTVSANATSYSNAGLTPLTSYCYRIKSYNSAGNSAYSNIATATTTSGSTVPTISAPSTSAGTFTITMQYPFSGTLMGTSDGYRLEESTTSPTSGFSLIHTSPVTRDPTYTYTLTRSNGVYYYRTRVYDWDHFSPYSDVISVSVNAPPQTAKLRLINNTKYDMIDIQLNGTQYVTVPNTGILIGNYYEAEFNNSGNVSYTLGVGFWNNNVREDWFILTGSANVTVGSTTSVTFNNPTIGQFLSGFSASRNWDGWYYDDNGIPHAVRFNFTNSGGWTFYVDGNFNSSGSVTLVSWPNYATIISFKVCSSCTPILLGYPFGCFQYSNGPPSWPVIEYCAQ